MDRQGKMHQGRHLYDLFQLLRNTRSIVVLSLLYLSAAWFPPQSEELFKLFTQESRGLDQLLRLVIVTLITAAIGQTYASGLLISEAERDSNGRISILLHSRGNWGKYWPLILAVTLLWGVPLLIAWSRIKPTEAWPAYVQNYFGFIAVVTYVAGVLALATIFKFELKVAGFLRLSSEKIRWARSLSLSIIFPLIFGLVISYIVFDTNSGGTLATHKLGPLFIFQLFVATNIIVFSVIQQLGNNTGWPILSLTLLLAIAIAVKERPRRYPLLLDTALSADDIRLTHPGSIPMQLQMPQLALRDWLRHRGPQRREVFFVVAQGGGLYAAYHSALTLARLQDACGNFYDRFFAGTGVSGGSIGILVFSAVADAVRQVDNQAGVAGGCNPKDPGQVHQNIVREVFEGDFLTPLLVNGLFVDYPFGLLRDVVAGTLSWFGIHVEFSDRADALKRVVLERTEKAVRRALKGNGNPLRILKSRVNEFDVTGPTLLFSTTVVETGAPLIFGPVDISNAHLVKSGVSHISMNQLFPGQTIDSIDAAVLSARFPVVTPAATLTNQSGKSMRIVDGG